MIALQITDQKLFTRKLFLEETFDGFALIRARFQTKCVFDMDVRLIPEYYNEEERRLLEEEGRHYSSWKEIKPYCTFLIKGKRLPLSFDIQLMAIPRPGMSPDGISPDDVTGLSLNIQYRNSRFLCTTGVSYRRFILDKAPETAWDHRVKSFFFQETISFEEL